MSRAQEPTWDEANSLEETLDDHARAFPTVAGYRIDLELGRGGMGVVYQARDRSSGRDVALKMALEPSSGDRAERFRREVLANGRLVHPNVVQVHHAGEVDGRLYMVSELVPDARDLREVLRGGSVAEGVGLILQALEGLAHAHCQGVVHRDVKAENLLLGSDGRVRVADFGLAYLWDLERLTRTGTLLGTPNHMAPEQMLGDPIGPWTDVWAVGVLLYDLLYDEFPFGGGTLQELLAQVTGGTPTWGPLNTPLERRVAAVSRRALEKTAEDRFADAGALAAALREALGASEGPRRGPALLAACVGLGLTLALGAVLRDGGPSAKVAPAPAPPPAQSVGESVSREEPAPEPPDWSRPQWVQRHRSGPAHCAFASDERLLSLGRDGQLRAWSVRDGREVPGSQLKVRAQEGAHWLSGRPGVVVIGGEAEVQVVTSAATRVHALPVVGVAVSADGQRIALGCSGGAGVQVVGLQGEVVARCEGIRRDALLPRFSPDGRALAVGSGQAVQVGRPQPIGYGANALRIFEVETGRLLLGPLRLPSWLRALTWTPDGRQLIGGSLTGQIMVIDGQSGEVVDYLVDPAVENEGGVLLGRAHTGSLRGVAFDPSGTRMFSVARGHGESVLKEWSLSERAPLNSVQLEDQPLSMAVSPSGRFVAIGGLSGRVELWRVGASESR